MFGDDVHNAYAIDVALSNLEHTQQVGMRQSCSCFPLSDIRVGIGAISQKSTLMAAFFALLALNGKKDAVIRCTARQPFEKGEPSG